MKKTKLLAFILTCAIFLSTLIVPIAAETNDADTTPTMIYNNAKPITVDGKKDVGEYGETPHMVLNKAVKNSMAEDLEGTPASSPNLYLSTDGKNLYVFYEIAQNIINIAENQSSLFYFSFETRGIEEDTTSGWQSYGIEGYSGQLLFYLGTNPSKTQGFNRYYYKKDTAVGTEAFKAETCTGTGTMLVNGVVTDTYTVEIKIPLAEDVQKAMAAEGGTTIEFSAVQNKHTIVEYPDTATTTTAGNTSLIGEDSYAWNNCDQSNQLVVLARPVIAGFQSRQTPDATGSVDVRFVSVMKADAEKLTNMQAGYDFTYYDGNDTTGNKVTVNCKKAYGSLSAGEELLKASDFGGDYFFCYSLDELSYGSSYTFDVACWTQEDSESDRLDGIQTVRVTVTVSDSGEVSFTY